MNIFAETMKKSDIQKRMELIAILDPLKLNTEYSTLTVDQLKEILKKKTNTLADITHEQYQEIYDLPVDMPSRSNEVAVLEFRISNLNIKLRDLSEINDKLEEELLMSQMEIDKLRKLKVSKIPTRDSTPEPGSFASYIASQENEDEEFKSDSKKKQNNDIPVINRSTYPVYAGYTPSKMLNFPDQGLFAPLIQNTQHVKSVNGTLSEHEAISLAIKESETLANAPLDRPFNGNLSPINNGDPFDKLDNEIAKSKPIQWRERPDRYKNLKNRPVEATDEILDRIYDYLIERNFDSVKIMISNEINNPEVVKWIRSLNYDGSNFKQMMMTKSHVIHRVFCGDM
jgi:hypothetical protein